MDDLQRIIIKAKAHSKWLKSAGVELKNLRFTMQSLTKNAK